MGGKHAVAFFPTHSGFFSRGEAEGKTVDGICVRTRGDTPIIPVLGGWVGGWVRRRRLE